MSENKVTFGLKNVHYAPITETAGTITYGTPKPIPGGVEISLEPRGDLIEFYADNMLYYSAANNQGYDGSLSIANIPESFAIDCLGEEKDTEDGTIVERSTSKGNPFALLFEFDGDVKATRHVLYNCSANRPNVASSTKTNSAEPNVNELTFVASPRSTDYVVKRKTSAATTQPVYDNWYTKVHVKGESLINVSIEPKTASVASSGTQQLIATVTGTENTSVTWTSSDETVATVSSSGLVTIDSTAITGETATITATSVQDVSKSDTAVITVS